MSLAPARKRHTFRDYWNRRVLTMLALILSSGLPFNLVANTFAYWLRDEHIALSAIGFISWVGFAYSLKFLWAPVLIVRAYSGAGLSGTAARVDGVDADHYWRSGLSPWRRSVPRIA